MANTIEYIYELIDRYSKPLKQVTQATSSFRMQVNKTCEAMDRLSSKFERLPVNMRNFKRTIGSPVFQNQIQMLKTETRDIAQNIDKMGRASAKFSIQSKGLRAGKTVPAGGGVGGGLAGRFSGAAGAITGLGAAIGGTAITAGIFRFAQSASSLADAMADVSRVTGMAGPELESMQQSLQRIGRATGRSAEGLAAIAYEGGKLGIANQDLTGFVQTVMKTAVAFDMADQEAGRAIGSIRAKLGLSVQSVDDLMQRVNYLADTTSASGEKMINIIERTSGTFSVLKVPKEVTAGWAAFADQIEVSPERAASGLNMMMSRLMQMPGMMNKMLKDPQNAVIDFVNQLSKIPEAKQGPEILKMFGEEAGKFVLKIVPNLKLLDSTMRKAASTKALGSMDREFENLLKRSSTAAKRIKETFIDISRAIGRVFLNVFDKYSERIRKATQAVLIFVKTNPVMVKVIGGIGLLMAGLSAIVFPLGVLMAMVGAAIPLFTALAGAQLAILWPIAAVVAAFTVLSAIFAAMWYKSTAFRQSLSNLADAFSPLVELVKPAVVWIGEKLGLAFSDAGSTMQLWGDIAATVINMVAAMIKTLIQILIEFGGYWKDVFSGNVIGVIERIGGWGGGMLDKIGAGSAKEKAAGRQDNKIEVSGSIGVSATGGAKIERADIGLNTGYNLAVMH